MRGKAAYGLAIGFLCVSIALALSGCGGSSRKPSSSSRASRPPGGHAVGLSSQAGEKQKPKLLLRLRAPSGQPKANRSWSITLTARTSTGKPVHGTVSYAFVFGGAVVAKRPGGKITGGVFHDGLRFPTRAIGIPLTLRVIVKTRHAQSSVDRSVVVRR